MGAESSARHIVLIGLPGSGKTTVGRAVAAQLGRPFVDFDEEIERREGRSVAEIFARDGESRFRALERSLTQEFVDVPAAVLAPGGGWAAIPGCLEALQPVSEVVYLEVEPAVAVARMQAAIGRRPLLDRPDPAAALRELLTAREYRYLLANHRLEVSQLREIDVAARIVALAAAK